MGLNATIAITITSLESHRAMMPLFNGLPSLIHENTTSKPRDVVQRVGCNLRLTDSEFVDM